MDSAPPQHDAAAGSATANVMMGALGSTIKDKWSSSSGPAAFSSFSSSLPDGIKSRAGALTSSYLSPRFFRPLSTCFGTGEARPYYLETNPALFASRVHRNLRFYYLNYLALAAVLFAATLMVSPSSIIAIAILAAAWAYVVKLTGGDTFTVGGVLITSRVASAFMSAVTLVCLIWVLSSVFWYSLSLSLFLALAHAAARDATMVGDEDDKVEMDGDLEDVPFLNAQEEHEQV